MCWSFVIYVSSTSLLVMIRHKRIVNFWSFVWAERHLSGDNDPDMIQYDTNTR